MDSILSLLTRLPSFKPQVTPVTLKEADLYTRGDLARLNAALRSAQQRYDRESELYLEVVRGYRHVTDVSANVQRGPGPFLHSFEREAQELPIALRWLKWYWYCRVRSLAMRLLAILLAAFSIGILVSEATISDDMPNLSLVCWLLLAVRGNKFLLEMVVYLCLLYTCACANFALFKLGKFSFYLLVPRHTPPFSLLSNALLACRFSVSIAYNFMQAMALPESTSDLYPDVTNTVFYKTLGTLYYKWGVARMRMWWYGVWYKTVLTLLMIKFNEKCFT